MWARLLFGERAGRAGAGGGAMLAASDVEAIVLLNKEDEMKM